MKQENLELRASYARLLGWTAIGLGVLSGWPWLETWLFDAKGIGKSFAFGSYLALAMPLVAVVAVLINPGALKTRSRAPVVALALGLVLVAAWLYMISDLAHLVPH